MEQLLIALVCFVLWKESLLSGDPSLHLHKPGLCWYTWVDMLFCGQSPPITYTILLVDRRPAQSGCRGWRKESSAVLIAYWHCHWFPCSFLFFSFFSCCKLISSPQKYYLLPGSRFPVKAMQCPVGNLWKVNPLQWTPALLLRSSIKWMCLIRLLWDPDPDYK